MLICEFKLIEAGYSAPDRISAEAVWCAFTFASGSAVERIAILPGDALTLALKSEGRSRSNMQYGFELSGITEDAPGVAGLAAGVDGNNSGTGRIGDPAGEIRTVGSLQRAHNFGQNPVAFIKENDST